MNDTPNIVVLCTGNSCRSQMAEGYLRHFAADRFHAQSAGTAPQDRVHPHAVRVMAEDGVDISLQRPTSVEDVMGRMPVRFLIVVCGGAKKSCELVTWPGVRERLFWPFDDPVAFAGTPAETLEEFRRVRDEIKTRVLTWLEAA